MAPPEKDPAPPARALAARVAPEARERIISWLGDHFAEGRLDVDEFERRVTLAHTAADPAALEALLADLPAAPAGAPARAAARTAATQLVPTGRAAERGSMMALMGGVHRQGPWTVPRRLKVRAIMGGVILDFREARIPEGGADVHIDAVMGGVQIIVPPHLALETHGTAIMGGFEALDRAPAELDPATPFLRIHGLAVMGGVGIETRLPGETERQAHKRRRRELGPKE
jgi:hypothetical protein